MNNKDILQPLIFPEALSLRKLLKLKRIHDELTQAQVAEIIGCSGSTVSEIETGTRNIPYKYLEAVKQYIYEDYYIDGVLQKDE